MHVSDRSSRWPWRLAFIATLLLTPAAHSAPAYQSTLARLASALDVLNRVVARSFAGALPVPSAAFGVQYTFDPASASFVRAPATSGQAYVERGETLGRHRLNVSLAWERVVLDEIGGQPAGRLPGGRPIRLAPNLAFALQFAPTRADATANQLVPTLMWGLTDTLDVGVTLPLIHSNTVIQTAAIVAARGEDGVAVLRERFDESTNDWDIGDLLLRAKQRLPGPEALEIAAGLTLRLPTGDLDTLRGSGATFVTPQLTASTRRWSPATWATLQGHIDVAAELDATDVGASVPRWGLGLDWGVSDSATFAIAFLGRHPLRRLAPAGALGLRRCPTLTQCLQSADDIGFRPLYGIDSNRPDYFDFSVGGRVALWRDTIMGFANVVVPLNQAGVRFEPIPLVGIEGTF